MKCDVIAARHQQMSRGRAAITLCGKVVFLAIGMCIVVVSTAVTREAAAADSGPKLAPIQLTPERRQLIGLQIATVEEKDLTGRIDTTGLVDPDEQLDGYVQTRFAPWIRQPFVHPAHQLARQRPPPS